MGDQMPDATGDALVDFTERALPPAFERRLITIEPGAYRAFAASDWGDSLVVLECGEIELECLGGHREHVEHGAIFWLAGLPLRALHNAGAVPAVLVAISRRKADGDR
ncbi:MAG: hypothetical protein E6G66_12350 [Actinobacteria bacterium]|nr:MAG: hypothetical protein E6G66_12350 [Actinomycetota bacterium]